MELLGFRRVPEDAAPGRPVACALVALWRRGRPLMVRVRGRDCWELPGGGVEPGETSRRAAARELLEATGRVVAPQRLRFAGFPWTAPAHRRRVLLGAPYTARAAGAAEPVPFAPTDETAVVRWCAGGEPPAGGAVQTADGYLARPTPSRASPAPHTPAGAVTPV